MIRVQSKFASLALAAAVLAGSASLVRAQSLTAFSSGDLVVLRGGDSTYSQSTYANGEVPAYLDEYQFTAGFGSPMTLVGSLPLSTGATPLTLPGNTADSHEGALDLSGDGQSISLAGYSAAVSATVARPKNNTVADALVDDVTLNASITTTPLTGALPSYVRSAYTNDGNEFWVGSKYPNGGLDYVAGSGPSATTTALETTTDFRNVEVVTNSVSGSTLYGGTGSSNTGPEHGFYQIGSTGTPPTAPTPTNTLLTVNPQLNAGEGESSSGFVLLNIPTTDANAQSYNGFNVLYTIGDQTNPGISKYYYNDGNWVPTSSQVEIGSDPNFDPEGLVVTPASSGSSTLDIAVSGYNGIYTFIDTSGDPTAPIPAASFTEVATPVTGGDFYGLAQVPEPASIGLMSMGAVALLARRRSRKA